MYIYISIFISIIPPWKNRMCILVVTIRHFPNYHVFLKDSKQQGCMNYIVFSASMVCA